jgi:Zn-dependent protease
MSLILLGVALVNMLPMFPFDGDRYFDTLLASIRVPGRLRKYVRTGASAMSLGLLGLNLILSFVIFGTIFPK